ncbi:hypothetical protein CF123_17745 [Aeromonas veronii]|uniref:DNA-binding protein n=1 Tax=Aeromonas veronii TaxID=654 RepID=A0AAX2UNW7_AERVE|nr:hypothetical protein [Aeromonas veronii]TND51961.1 hypothetical protein CF123_17745 [Aeromonas veronii]
MISRNIKSQFISQQSIPLTQLAADGAPGDYGLYKLAHVDDLSDALVRQKFSSGVKAVFAKYGKQCVIQRALLVTDIDDESPATSKMMMVTVGKQGE